MQTYDDAAPSKGSDLITSLPSSGPLSDESVAPTYASSMSEVLVAFDLYGTLLSTSSVAKALAEHFGEDKANSIAQLWRRYQLEYTWRLNSMSKQCRVYGWYTS
jgi:hypothetical protein